MGIPVIRETPDHNIKNTVLFAFSGTDQRQATAQLAHSTPVRTTVQSIHHRGKPSCGPMPNLNRIACFWALGASCASEGRSSADHPLCRTLISASGEQGQPTRFPSAYVCHGEGDGSTCAPRTEEEEQLTGANVGKAGMHKVGCIQYDHTPGMIDVAQSLAKPFLTA